MSSRVAFQGWNDLTYFDVSAIVNPNDHAGVKQMFPASQLNSQSRHMVSGAKFSGCEVFPCSTAYYLADDVQTVTTDEVDLVCTLGQRGSAPSATSETKVVSRHYVLGKLS